LPSPDRHDHVVHVAGDRELSPEEAARAPDRISRYYAGDELVRVEVVRDGQVRMIRYIDELWPDDELLAAHRSQYGEHFFEVLSPTSAAPGGGRRRRVWTVRGDGTLGEYSDHQLDDDGEILVEERFKPDGRLFHRTEYEYDDHGELVLTREIDADGTVLDEYES
jgi:hypothetical protein